MGLLIDKKQKNKCRMLTEEKLDEIGATLEHTPRKSLKHLAQETGVSKSSVRTATQLLKLRPYKTSVIHALQQRDTAGRVHFCSWFLQSVVKCEIDPHLTFFSDDACFHLQGYIITQNNSYWSSQNPQLTESPAPSSESWCLVCC
jgi:transcriptional antiterminator